MLDLFRRPTDPPEYGWLYAVPAALFAGAFFWAASTGTAGLVQAGYAVSTLLSIGALTGLSSQVGLSCFLDCSSSQHWIGYRTNGQCSRYPRRLCRTCRNSLSSRLHPRAARSSWYFDCSRRWARYGHRPKGLSDGFASNGGSTA